MSEDLGASFDEAGCGVCLQVSETLPGMMQESDGWSGTVFIEGLAFVVRVLDQH